MIFYHPPKLRYCGLTIILGRPSRFDTDKLISGKAGDNFDRLLSPYNRFNCDIRVSTDTRPFIDGTKVLLLLGDESIQRYAPGKDLLTYRGSPLELPNGLIAIPSITPQDANDRKNYEAPDEEENETDEEGKEKDRQKTSRKNFRFWLSADVKKAIRILTSGIRKYPAVEYIICPQPEIFLNKLSNWRGGFLTTDIETDPFQNITCFSVGWSDKPELDYTKPYEIYTIPFKRYDNSILYSQLDYARIFRALTFAFRENTVVDHNLCFDLFVFLFKYYINPPRLVHDTMVAMNRMHPEIEKSLAHVISYFTDLIYHKDEGVFAPKNYHQEQQLWAYNGKDVATTWFVFCAQQQEMDKLKARASVEQGCRTMRSILAMQYEGVWVDKQKLCSIVDNNDKDCEQILRLLKPLTGGLITNPRSTDQVSNYLYKTLGLEKPQVKAKLKQTKKDNGPTGKEALYKLYLKTQLPSIRCILEYKRLAKRASSLRNLRLWRDDRLTCAYSLCTETFRLRSRELLSFNAPKEVL